jgi:hypothetical protein
MKHLARIRHLPAADNPPDPNRRAHAVEPAGLMISAAVSYSLRLPIDLEGEFSATHR